MYRHSGASDLRGKAPAEPGRVGFPRQNPPNAPGTSARMTRPPSSQWFGLSRNTGRAPTANVRRGGLVYRRQNVRVNFPAGPS